MLRTAALIVLCAPLVGSAGCRESKPQPDSDHGPSKPLSGDTPCPRQFSELPPADGEQSCICPSKPTGRVWGSGIYTAESSLCSAAVHAGAITTEGGKVSVRSAPGCPSYLGSTNNKVSTSPAAAADKSYFFPSVSDGKCGPDTKRD